MNGSVYKPFKHRAYLCKYDQSERNQFISSNSRNELNVMHLLQDLVEHN